MKLRTTTDIPPSPAAPRPLDSRPSTPVDTVSSRSGDVQAAVEIARTERSTRLAVLSAAVREGSYEPDPARIADAIAQDAELTSRLRELLASRT